jgi:hypothetical protein
MTAPAPECTTVRSLVSEDLFGRLAARVAADEQLPAELAERIIEQTLVFLLAASRNQGGRPLAPSAMVDLGWHAFVLYTRQYAAFCDRIAGRFLHHAPTDDGRATGDPAATRRRTVAALTATGYPVDADLWSTGADCDVSGEGDSCSQCHAGCTDSP